MLLFLHTWYCGVLESGGGREPLCSVMLLHVKEILPHRQTDNLLNSEGVEISGHLYGCWKSRRQTGGVYWENASLDEEDREGNDNEGPVVRTGGGQDAPNG